MKRTLPMEQQDGARVSTAYLRFAEDEVRDRSPLYHELSRGVASDPEVIGLLLTLPREKRQPNLFLSAARHLFGTPTGSMLSLVAAAGGGIQDVVTTQAFTTAEAKSVFERAGKIAGSYKPMGAA
jgi:hypothetical protein